MFELFRGESSGPVLYCEKRTTVIRLDVKRVMQKLRLDVEREKRRP